jgi:hypothetical protein
VTPYASVPDHDRNRRAEQARYVSGLRFGTATEAPVTILDLDVAPETAGRRPRRLTAPSRPVALFVVGLVTLLLVTASARPATPVAGVLWAGAYDRDNDTMTVTPTSLFVVRQQTLTAYDLATGATRWSAPAPAVMSQVPSVADGVVVAPDGFERYFEQPDLVLARTTRTVARDARTGAVLWRAAGAPQVVSGGSVLLADGDRLRDVGLHDGRSRWSRPVTGLSSAVVLGDAVVTAAADGRLTVLGYGDGSLRRTEKVPWPGRAWLSAAAGRLVVTSQGPSGLTSSVVYRPGTLAELWRADGTLADCHAVLCGTDPGGLIGYDPDTGARRWTAAGMTVAWPVRDDRIVASSELNGRFQLLDPATGRAVGAPGSGLGSWRTEGRSAVADAPAPSSVFALRGETDAPGGAVVVRIDVGTGSRYLLGAIGGTGWIGCRNVAKYLVCLRDSRLTVIAAD